MLPSHPLSCSVSTALIFPRRLHGMSSIHNTLTHAPPTLVFCHVGFCMSRDLRASGQPPGSLASQPDVLQCHASSAFCTHPPLPPPSISSHAIQPLPSGIMGHPLQHWSCVVATCVRLRGRLGHALSSSALPREEELYAGGDE